MLGRFYTCILPLVVALPTGVIFYEWLVFNVMLSGSALYLNNTSLFVLYALWCLSYYQSIVIKNTHSNYSILPRRKVDRSQYNSSAYLNNNTCDREGGRFKPMRCSHCHVCGCVLRMVTKLVNSGSSLSMDKQLCGATQSSSVSCVHDGGCRHRLALPD